MRKHRIDAAILATFWKGELPLALSFWGGWVGLLLFGWVVELVITGSGLWLIGQLGDGRESYVIVLAVLASSAIGLTALVWWSVGVWRSSRRYCREGGTRSWTQLARIAVCFFLLLALYSCITDGGRYLSDAVDDIREDPDSGLRGVRYVKKSAKIVVFGHITRSVASELKHALVSHPQVVLVEFNSTGGRLGPALQIKDEVASRHLTTYVSEVCISACTVAFLGGKRRIITTSAKFGFHAGMFGGDVSERGDDTQRQAAVSAGVSPWFVERAYNSSVIWYPSTDELLAAHIATDLDVGENREHDDGVHTRSETR